jgi:TrmH family RNA methyltransferase
VYGGTFAWFGHLVISGWRYSARVYAVASGLVADARSLITSTHNQHVAWCRTLHRTRTRREAGAFLIEGVRLAWEALDAGIEPVLALYDGSALVGSESGTRLVERLAALPNAYEANRMALAAAAETRTPQGVVLAAGQPVAEPLGGVEQLLLVLDGLADAGNAGTILRSAAAAGLSTVVFAGDSVDPWIGKVVRSGAGAHFRVRIVESTWGDLTPHLGRYAQVLAADASAAASMYDVSWIMPTAVIVGSEAHGLSAEAREMGVTRVRIPMAGGVESLNAAMAASIILFEAARPN